MRLFQSSLFQLALSATSLLQLCTSPREEHDLLNNQVSELLYMSRKLTKPYYRCSWFFAVDFWPKDAHFNGKYLNIELR